VDLRPFKVEADPLCKESLPPPKEVGQKHKAKRMA